MRFRLHAALVHFPVVCWTVAAVLELTSPLRDEPVLFNVDTAAAALMLIWLGLLFVLPAVTAGLFELARAPQGRDVSRHSALHVTLVGSAVICFTLSGLALQGIAGFDLGQLFIRMLLSAGLLMLMAGAHVGSWLVSYCEQASSE